METKWYNNFNLNMTVVVILSIFNFMMIFFAAGYIDTIWKISNTMSEFLALSSILLFVINTILLLRGVINKN